MNLHEGLRVTALLLAATAAAWGFTRLEIPAGALLGPMLLGLGLPSLRLSARLPVWAGNLSQGIIAGTVGATITAEVAARIVTVAPLALTMLAATLLVSVVLGLLAARLTGIEREAAIWGFLPGMAGLLILQADRKGLDSRAVAVLQMLRLALVIGVLVLAHALLIPPGGAVAAAGSPALPLLPDLPATGLIGFALLLSVILPGWPSAGFNLVLPVAAGVTLLGMAPHFPAMLQAMAFGIMGVQIGAKFDRRSFALFGRLVPVLAGLTVAMILLCGLLGLALAHIAGLSGVSATLAMVPGGVDWIVLLALGSGADVGFVATMQILRTFVVALIGPLLAAHVGRHFGARQ